MRHVLTTTLLALAIGASSAGPAVAQDTPDGFMTALGSVPDTLEVRMQPVSWIDYRALLGSRAGAAQPASIAELLALLDADDPAARIWVAALNGASSGSGKLLQRALSQGADWPRTVGFDFIDVRSELAFGQAPGDGIVLQGDFDPERIGEALAARDFSSTDAGSFALWCRSDGCDEGLRQDLANRDLADPFGGDLGRRQPLAVSPSTLLSSAVIDTVDGMIGASTGGVPSLADDATVAAVAEALGTEGTLLQAMLVPPSLLVGDPMALLDLGSGPDEIGQRLAELAETFEPIPAASLMGIGDAATATEQVVTLAFAYPTLADAQRAADVLPRRLDTMTSLRTQQTWREMLDARGAGPVEARAVERADGDGALALLTVRAPLAGPDPDPETGLMIVSSVLYRLFAQMVVGRDTTWLIPELPTLD